MINPNDIKPKVTGKADFSWQLYRWIKKYPESYHVYSDNDPSFPCLYIGMIANEDPDYCYGRAIRQLCVCGEKIKAYAYGGSAYNVCEWSEVTEQFWSEYMKKGICAIHGDLVHKWNVSGNTRTCQYCGKVEYKKTVMIPKEVWEDAENTSEI